jgi:hypothetical protein
VVSLAPAARYEQFDVIDRPLRDGALLNEDWMTARIAKIAVAVAVLLMPCWSYAQDVPGIEICTVEKTMERRTSCLQSNVDFLQKTINKLTLDQQQKQDAANRQIEALKGSVIALQKIVDDQQKKTTEELKKKADAPAAK